MMAVQMQMELKSSRAEGRKGTRTTNDGMSRARREQAVLALPERVLLREDVESGRAQVLYFVPLREFYGGHLVYRMGHSDGAVGAGVSDDLGRLYRQWAGNATVKRMCPDLPVTEPV